MSLRNQNLRWGILVSAFDAANLPGLNINFEEVANQAACSKIERGFCCWCLMANDDWWNSNLIKTIDMSTTPVTVLQEIQAKVANINKSVDGKTAMIATNKGVYYFNGKELVSGSDSGQPAILNGGVTGAAQMGDKWYIVQDKSIYAAPMIKE